MSTPIHLAATAAPQPWWPLALSDAMRALRSLAQAIDAWRQARKQSAQDRDALASMSERDLRDIGIARVQLGPVSEKTWMRDCPF